MENLYEVRIVQPTLCGNAFSESSVLSEIKFMHRKGETKFVSTFSCLQSGSNFIENVNIHLSLFIYSCEWVTDHFSQTEEEVFNRNREFSISTSMLLHKSVKTQNSRRKWLRRVVASRTTIKMGVKRILTQFSQTFSFSFFLLYYLFNKHWRSYCYCSITEERWEEVRFSLTIAFINVYRRFE